MNAASVLSVSSLSVALPTSGDRLKAVDNVSLDVHAGETVCIVGESGSGKSVTASSIMGLTPLNITGGRILLQGEDITNAKEERLRRLRGSRMSMVFQEPMTALNPLHRVGDQVAELLHAHPEAISQRPGRVEEMVEQMFADVHLPNPRVTMTRYPHQLSGGQRQRVMIAMALILEPALLIADEPTTALDVTTQAQILKLLREMQSRRGTGVLFITHDFGVVSSIADRVIVMKQGEIVEQGGAKDVLTNPRHPYTKMLIEAVPRLMPKKAEDTAEAVVLKVDRLTKIYPSSGASAEREGHIAVDRISLTLRKGRTLGIVGESGSGKSTAARCLSRLIDPTEGDIVLEGTNIARLSARQLHPFRRRIQVIFQDPYRSLNPRRLIGESIIEGPLNFGVKRTVALDLARRLLKTVGIEPSALERYPHQFSGGQRQRIAIARALAMEPEILVADEAVSALDVSVQAQVLTLLEEIRDRMRLGILFITHDLRVAARMCDHIAVMQSGRIVEFAECAALFSAPKHEYTRQLLDAVPGKDWLEIQEG